MRVGRKVFANKQSGKTIWGGQREDLQILNIGKIFVSRPEHFWSILEGSEQAVYSHVGQPIQVNGPSRPDQVNCRSPFEVRRHFEGEDKLVRVNVFDLAAYAVLFLIGCILAIDLVEKWLRDTDRLSERYAIYQNADLRREVLALDRNGDSAARFLVLMISDAFNVKSTAVTSIRYRKNEVLFIFAKPITTVRVAPSLTTRLCVGIRLVITLLEEAPFRI